MRTLLDSAAADLRKAGDGSRPQAMWWLVLALGKVVEYLRRKEDG